MTTYRKAYKIVCGSMTQDHRFTKPTFKQVEAFIKQNSPTNNEVEVVKYLVEVQELEVSRP